MPNYHFYLAICSSISKFIYEINNKQASKKDTFSKCILYSPDFSISSSCSGQKPLCYPGSFLSPYHFPHHLTLRKSGQCWLQNTYHINKFLPLPPPNKSLSLLRDDCNNLLCVYCVYSCTCAAHSLHNIQSDFFLLKIMLELLLWLLTMFRINPNFSPWPWWPCIIISPSPISPIQVPKTLLLIGNVLDQRCFFLPLYMWYSLPFTFSVPSAWITLPRSHSIIIY